MKLKATIYALASLALFVGIHGDAYAQLQSQVVAGSDNGTTRRILKTDNTGRLEVVGAAAGGVAYGPDNQGSAPSQAPITIGCTFASPSVAAGQIARVQCDSAGRLVTTLSSGSLAVTQSTSPWVVGQTTAANLKSEVVGPAADDAAASGNPVPVGGIYNTTLPTYTNLDRTQFQFGSRGSVNVQLMSPDSNSPVAISTNLGDGYSNNFSVIQTRSGGALYNGTGWDRWRTMQGLSGTAGLGVGAVGLVPSSAVGGAVATQQTTAVASSLVLCTAACNLYSVALTTGAASGYLLVFDATSAPADGAVTPKFCRAVSSQATVELDYSAMPRRMTTGATAVFSTTGCYTKTASVTAAIEGASIQ
jgi:hypothetical protein